MLVKSSCDGDRYLDTARCMQDSSEEMGDDDNG